MTTREAHPIIGVGASAGGVEALEGLLRGMAKDPGFALVIVTHLSPDRESLLHEVVRRYTDLPVHVAADGMAVEKNQIYVMPPDVALTIRNRRLQMRTNSGSRERKPIDIFLRALAVDLGEMAGGIILSGGDGDGTLGLKAIKESGGVTLAQVSDGYGPRHSDMPNAAISSGFVDFAVPAEQMGPKLANFVRGLPLDGKLAEVEAAAEDQTVDEALPEIFFILRNQIGHDFSGYKTKTFVRRVQRRMQIAQLDTLEDYVDLLRREPTEVAALFRDLLINVTNFFRDPEAFELLGGVVIPKLFERKGAHDLVRIWVPGCATGEEVFSIGMLVREHLQTLTAVPRVQIFATDIDEHAIEVARAARYPEGLLAGISPERRQRFLIPEGAGFVVSKDVRELCIFSSHSVIRDPPFSRMDLVSCRNLLIYLGADIQNQVIPVFHYALRPDGYLFLGTAESVGSFGDLFAPIDRHLRIFRRRSDTAVTPALPVSLRELRSRSAPSLLSQRLPLAGAPLRQTIDGQVLDRFSPPHVAINSDGDVVYYSARTGKYLEAPGGAPTRQLLALARRGLRLDLRTLIREVDETGATSSRNGVSLEDDEGRVQIVNLTVEPLGHAKDKEPLYLVIFADVGTSLSREEALARTQVTYEGTAAHTERELREARDRLQTIIEEYETALEELKSSNEELVSVNEEMQSANEEIESSKEELQSVNEELHTVNAELNGKIEALDRANSDLQNLFGSTDVATIFLDKNLVIRSFTPAVTKIFNVLATDKGRPITDFSSRIPLADFTDEIQRVFGSGSPVERRVAGDNPNTNYLIRLAPYRNVSQKIDGVVITFVDVTILTRAEARQRVLISELQHRTRNLLAVVQSLAQQTIGKGGSLDSFISRLSALGRVQGLMSGAMDDHIDLADLVRLELEATGAPEEKLTIKGPSVSLGFELVQTFGLALHELATNAVKYGSLTKEGGKLAVSWNVRGKGEDVPVLVLDWKESGVPNLAKPSRRGFGRELLEKALQFTLQAKTDLMFGDDGVSCHIELPLPHADNIAVLKG